MSRVLVVNGLRTAHGRRAAALLITPTLLFLDDWVTVPVPQVATLALEIVLVLALGARSWRRPAR